MLKVVEAGLNVLEVVLNKLESCAEGGRDCALYAGGCECCAMCAMSVEGHALYANWSWWLSVLRLPSEVFHTIFSRALFQ